MRNLLLCALAIAFSMSPAVSQTRKGESPTALQPGEVVRIGNDLTLKVTKSTQPLFKGVNLKGEATIAVLEFDAGRSGATVLYKASTDARQSELYLTTGTEMLAPRAVIEDFPSWGSDNDKEVEALDASPSSGGDAVTFQGKGSISLLFDVPAAQAKTAKKLSLVVRTSKPTVQKYSFVVNLQ